MSNTQTLDRTYIANTYARFPVELVSGKGSLLKGADGKDYIDLGSGIDTLRFQDDFEERDIEMRALGPRTSLAP